MDVPSPIATRLLQPCDLPHPCGLSWGVPWPRGTVGVSPAMQLASDSGCTVDCATHPLAYWPDGSVKWSRVDATLPPGRHTTFTLTEAAPQTSGNAVLWAKQGSDAITIVNGAWKAVFATTGSSLVQTLMMGQQVLGRNGQLLAWRERRDGDDNRLDTQRLQCPARITAAVIESASPQRIVLRFDGTHEAEDGPWLFFTLRVYVHAGAANLRMVHTFIYDGDPQRDFLAGIGMRMQVDLRDDPHNRHIWLAGDNADLWHEPAQLLAPHLFDKRASDHPQRAAQMRGEMVTAPQGPQQTPIWKSFTLVQESCDHFCIRKSCGRDHKAITAHHGHRATGMAALTGAQGGLAVTLNDCWQAYPRSLEVAAVGATQDDDASLTVWFWSPDAPAADLRHYDASVYTALYEAPFTYTPDRSRWDSGPIDPSVQSARGIARTSELTWHLLPQAPDPDELSRLAKAHVDGPVMVCAPQVYAASGTLGCWSLPSEGDDRARMLEVGQEKLLDFVLTQREARRWYGFWDNGDVVHSYDPHRQQWRYDEGGYAWNNGECVPDLWLWYSFLRSGRGDVFAFARAMTEHLRDVDTYHQGPHAGLGTRHNVTHWGCACKEPRISMAASRRILYYLTGGDERTGDVLDATCDAWPQTPTAMPLSPTWSSLGWNWLTQWERTGSTQHRDKLRRGMNDLLARKAPFMDEVMLVLDPATGGLSTPEPRQAYNHVMLLPFGGPELWFELADLFDDAPWRQALADYGRLWSLPGPKRQQHVPDGTAASAQIDHAVFSARMLAWAGVHTQDQALTDQALAILTSWCFDPQRITSVITAAPTGYTLPHPVTHQLTNYVQWGLNVIECLSLSRRLRGK